MLDTRIILAGLWMATMLTYLWGDVLRLMAGDVEPGKLPGILQPSQLVWLSIAVIMLLPILMIVLNLILKFPLIRWLNIIVAILVILFNLAGLPYKASYDNFLILVSFAFNLMTLWYAWKWVI